MAWLVTKHRELTYFGDERVGGPITEWLVYREHDTGTGSILVSDETRHGDTKAQAVAAAMNATFPNKPVKHYDRVEPDAKWVRRTKAHTVS